MTVLVISPHLDDAIFSLGAWIAGQTDVIVATVFAGVPGATVDPISDRYETAAEEVACRRNEDTDACHHLGAMTAHGRWLDGPYNGHAEPDEDGIARWIRGLEDLLDATALVRPAGVRHPQHQAVARAAALSHRPGVDRYAYAELPYSVLWPELMPDVVGELVDHHPDSTGITAKETACAMYASQYPDTDQAALSAPERLWRLP